ncbi:TonB-dependent receptor plug domain-containing protein [Steroidobacter agaridevorans]|uniref:TonB-dependent receptor plug domain-containing protein n=1 Tax=Steroidobacter agaridevorans TaxID=2695856 RepID=UPI00132072EE|nr:TonB-dependent receptor [Steroidobacter agaridevorans]GFE86463.1 TonB-dependent receptor [Steroidobacter agaridevorans]
MGDDSTRSLVRAALGLTLVFGGEFALAAESPAGGSADPGDTLEELTVTGSRIEHSGFQAPTPVSVLDASQVEQRGATNIANVINEIPAFTGTITPASTGLNSRQNGINAVDLRGLGTNRNLVLLNGRRGTPFDEFGNVDLNAVPSLAIGRVEVVTGGASAAWGSDAISGVVNLIYDDELEGFKFNGQYGQSEHGDAEDTRLAAAWGASLNSGSGHFLLAADYNKNEGVPEGRDRDWQRRSPALVSNPADTGPNDGIPQFLIRDNAVLFIGSPNGVTLPDVTGTAVDNLEFFSNGTAQTRQLGQVMDNFMIGGSGSRLGDRSAIFIPTERFNILATFRHDIGESTEAFVETSFAQSKSSGKLVDAFSFGEVVIMPDNPYLPASVAALGEAFPLFRTFEEIPPITSESKNDNVRFVAGLRGDFGNSFKWNASGQYGRTKFSNEQPQNLLVGNLILAADAVRDPVSGNIVCRANLNGANGAPGCVPINLFGKGSPSAAALDYVTDRGTSDTEIKQSVFMADVSGELFEAWAGPLLGTFGVEYRKEQLDRVVNAPNENDEFLIVNAKPLNGEFTAKEGFVEFALPMLKTDRQTLDLNAAARVTDYSTVGSVTTWKAGLVYSPVESLRLRGSISRDIRAPSIGETFVETVLLFGNITNPFLPGSPTEFVETPTLGNAELTEETAKTTTFGAVYSAGGFRASVDWYHIDLTDTIGVLAPQSVVNRCFAGETSLCDLIAFNPDGSIDSIAGKNLNLGAFDLEGIDAELRYSQPLGNGDLSVGVIASYLIHKEIAPSGGAPLDTAGEVGTASGYGTPDFKATLSVGYDIGDLGAFAQVRYIGSGVYDATYGPEELSAAENDIGAITYVDLSANYNLSRLGYGDVQVFAGVDNVLDKDPPVIPLNFISNFATNGSHYDVIGRKYYVGARVRF